MPYDATPFVTSLGPQALALPNHPDRHGHSVPVPPVAPVAPSPNFWWWLSDETRSRPDEAQLPKVPRSHLLEVARVPLRLEKVLAFGFLLCFDILLHELSFMPLQVLCALLRQVFRTNRASRRAAPAVTITEKCDLIRLSLLLANVALQSMFFSNSWVYHYIRGESFLKLYVFFNMLELAERSLRSVGVDLFDLLAARATGASGGAGAVELLPQYLLVLSYCFIHSSMHMLRVLLLTVAINTSSSAVFLIIVTNNFAEIKSTVFKRYEVKSLFPIITSDMVERFYLALDILFVLLRLATSDRRGLASAVQITSWLLLLVGIELGTDWVKFCLIMKFSELPVSVLENYQQVLIADLLVCRMPHTARDARPPSLPCMPFRGVQSFSHVVARRIGFSGLPLSTLVLSHLLHANLACQGPGVLLYLLLALILTLAKVLLSVLLLGLAARRRNSIARGLELFGKIKDRFVAVAGLDARFAAGEPECAAGSAQVAEEGQRRSGGAELEKMDRSKDEGGRIQSPEAEGVRACCCAIERSYEKHLHEEEDRRVAEEQERKRIGEKKSRGCVSSRGRQRREVAEQMEEWRLKAVEEEEKRAQN
ncbi:unnamed protein product [Durusdinium trenchii]|uniref:Uncharacterized protein n=1 Tax=Durusdinium trenchii TaxID=1381693 RepID=A0ABP0QDY5_9DINO